MHRNVFAYGSLQIPEVMAAVTGRYRRPLPARLPGYARYALARRVYPGLRRRAGAATDGVLYRNLDPLSVALLDRFEDPCYRRMSLTVITGAENPVAAEVYVIDPRHYRLFVGRSWSLSEFRRCFLRRYLRRCRRSPTASHTRNGMARTLSTARRLPWTRRTAGVPAGLPPMGYGIVSALDGRGVRDIAVARGAQSR